MSCVRNTFYLQGGFGVGAALDCHAEQEPIGPSDLVLNTDGDLQVPADRAAGHPGAVRPDF